MTETTPTSEEREDRAAKRLELIAAIILGLAGTLAAFAAFQGALADGNSLEKYTESTQALSDSNQFYSQQLQTFVSDQALFTEFAILAFGEDEADAAAADYIYSTIMNDNLRTAIDWWRETDDAVTPFDDDSPYIYEDGEVAEELLVASQEGFQEGATQNQVGDRFELAGVVLALTLFFAGISTLLSSRAVSVTLLLMATVSLVGGGVIVARALGQV